MEIFINRYFDFDYRIGFLLGIFFFLLYLKAPKYGRAIKRRPTIEEILFGILLSFYFVMLFGVTLLNRTPEAKIDIDLELFWSYKKTIQDVDIALGRQIIYNIIAFIPFGILIPSIYTNMRNWRKMMFWSMALSMFIETSQLIFRCGLCELDDVFNNTLGAMIGFTLFLLLPKKKKKQKKSLQIKNAKV